MKIINMLLLVFILSITLLVRAQPTQATPDPAQVRLVEVVNGLTRPLNLTHAGDNRLFVVEQGGRIRIIQNSTVNPTPFLDVSSLISRGGSEQGLLGLAFHPNYAQNGWFFINYTNTQGDTVVARYSVSADANVADAGSAAIVLTVMQPYVNHNGGHLAFGPDGYLYIGMGDGGSGGDPENRAQNPQTLLGKMLRIDVNQLPYTVPASNPFVGNSAYLPEIWALGVRNPWRFSFDRATGGLYMADVGQNMWEEVNFQAAGAGGLNYGWNIYEGNHQFRPGQINGAVMPIAEYDHGLGCSVTGGYVYRGANIPNLQGSYLYGDFCSGRIWSAYRNESGTWQSPLFLDTNYSISSFGEDMAGELYVIDHGGRVLRFDPIAAPDTPVPPTETPISTEPPTLEPTSTPLPPPTTPTLRIDVSPTSAEIGATVNAALNLFNVTNLYGLQVMCVVDPAVLAGTGYMQGEFNDSNSFFVSQNFQSDGSWLIAASRLQPNAPINGNVTAFTLGYIVQGAGSSDVTCSALAVDQDGRSLALDIQNGVFTGTGQSEQTPVLPTETSFPTETLIPTEMPTETPIPTELTSAILSTITGIATYQNRPDNAGITVQLLAVDGTLVAEQVTSGDGSYQFMDVALGVYSVMLNAPQHLSVLQESIMVETDGQTIDLGTDILPAGDADSNGIIDLADATLIGANFGVEVPPAPTETDLNGDNLVNISDLVLVGGNFGLQAPISGD